MTTTDMEPGSRELGKQARSLVRAVDRGGLATSMQDEGWPYASLVMTACDAAANPLLLISELAEHTQNILSDNRVGLLIDGTAGLNNPLTGTRMTIIGRAEQTADPLHMARYIARHPDADVYAGFTDFALYRIEVERVHMVAGFGAIHWIDQTDYSFDANSAVELLDSEAEIVSHMNNDHADALGLYASKLLGRKGDSWTMTGIDPEGCDLRLGGEVARLNFETPVTTANDARAALVRLVCDARETV